MMVHCTEQKLVRFKLIPITYFHCLLLDEPNENAYFTLFLQPDVSENFKKVGFSQKKLRFGCERTTI